MGGKRLVLVGFGLFASLWSGRAQIDPTKRELIQIGYNQPIQGRSPTAGYAFYHLNLPHFYRSNYAMRLAVAPIYADVELGIREALGPRTDVGLGLAGGGFADSYYELRQGEYERGESFTGHGGKMTASLYHRFNPTQRIPLHGLLRGEVQYAAYHDDDDTAPDFELPEDQPGFAMRAGVRWGGKEPIMLPDVAMEISVWYEGQWRMKPGSYGFDGDRALEGQSHLFWGRALLIYTLPEWKHTVSINLTGGTILEADRFSAYRLGGFLPLAAEFPLGLPGYYHQEISAETYGLLGVGYMVPLGAARRWALMAQGATALVDYVEGLSQPGQWHNGVGGGVVFKSPSAAWQIMLGYGYGVDAIRSGTRGAHAVGVLLQFDLGRGGVPLFDPGEQPARSRWLDRIFHTP